MRNKMTLSNRAKIFAPYDALKGFTEALKQKEIIYVKKKILSVDQQEDLNNAFKECEKGDLVLIKYYDSLNKNYLELEGILTNIDNIYKRICIVKKEINIEDIIDIKIIKKNAI